MGSTQGYPRFFFDGIKKTIWLEEEKRNALLTILHGWIRGSTRGTGIPLLEFQSVTSKLQHAFIPIPRSNGLLSPCNEILHLEPKFVRLDRNNRILLAVRECRTLLRESTLASTKCTELVSGWPDFVGVKDASSHGGGRGIVIGKNTKCTPTFFWYEWPDDIEKAFNEGRLTNSDLEIARLLLLWLVMESMCNLESGSHVALFSNNQPTVHWVQKMASKISVVAGYLIRTLALRLKMKGASPLTPMHIAGIHNAMADIPSRSFVSEPKWYCKNDSDLLHLFNETFPLPQHASWTMFRPTNKLCTRVLSVLWMHDITTEEWRRLPKSGKHIGEIGVPLSNLWEWTLTYRTPSIKKGSKLSPDLPASQE